MPTARPDSYTVASGADLYAGMAAPSPPPPPPPAPSITLSSTGNPTAGAEYSVTVTAANLTGPLVVTPENVSGTATFNPSTATPAPGELVKLFGATWAAAGAASIRATAPGGVVSNTLGVTVAPAPPPAPTIATLSGDSAATTGVAHSDTVTLDAAADQTYTVTWSRSNGGTGSATSTITTGQTSVSASTTWGAAGAGRTVDFTISPTLTRAGRPLPVTVSGPDLIRPPASGVSNKVALIGDSLTEHFFQACWFYWANGLLGAPLDVVANSGVSGRSIGDIENELGNSYKDAGGHPGLAGLPPLGWAAMPSSGTNGWRGAGSVASVDAGTQADFLSCIAQMKTYAGHVIIGPILPVVGITNLDSPWRTLAAYQRAACAADTSGLVHFLDATSVLLDGGGGGNPAYFMPDGYHLNALGSYVFGVAWSTQLSQLLINQGYARAPLVTDAADVYPAQPQWTTNPTNAGGGSTPTNVSVGQYGSGFTFSSSILAAAGGDSNTVPWHRVTPTAIGVDGYALTIGMTGAGRTVTTSDPSQLEHMVELRFNGLKGFRLLESWSQKTSGEKLTQKAYLQLDPAGVTGTVVLRLNFYRSGVTAGGPIEHTIYLWSAGADSGALGSIDQRCWSLRG